MRSLVRKSLLRGGVIFILAALFVWWGTNQMEFLAPHELEQIEQQLRRNDWVQERFGVLEGIEAVWIGAEKIREGAKTWGTYRVKVYGTKAEGEVKVDFEIVAQDSLIVTDVGPVD